MKILAVSDRVEPILYDRFDRDAFPPIDLILSCGDLPPRYLTFLVTVFNIPLYYIRGNHDIGYEETPPEGCVDLHGRIVEYRGIKVMGLEGSRWYNGGPLQYTERRMRKMVRKLRWRVWRRGGPDIVITHAPPRRIHDAEDPCHRGFKSFLPVIDRCAPRYFLHGHIHGHFENSSRRITTVDRTRVVNTFGYYLFDLDHEKTVP